MNVSEDGESMTSEEPAAPSSLEYPAVSPHDGRKAVSFQQDCRTCLLQLAAKLPDANIREAGEVSNKS